MQIFLAIIAIVILTVTFVFTICKGLGKVTDVDWDEIEKTHDKTNRK